MLLRAMELSVGELAQVLGQSQPRVSRHVKILADAGLTERRKEGSWVFLSLGEPDRLGPLLAAADVYGEGDDTACVDATRLAAVRADRAAAAERYFEGHAPVWDSIRSLHIAEAQVEDAVARAIGEAPMSCLVDIGTGTGRMLALFGRRAGKAIGIDRSSEMLRVARARLEEAGAGADLRQGDMYALPLPARSADLVILHQVLHYAQAPAAAIVEAARLLEPGGRLLIVDFAPHDREELRERDAHARLGFADDAMLGWLRAAGLDADVCEHLEGGELTVTLWRGTRPGSLNLMAKAA